MLSFIEYRTAAIYHSCSSSLASLDLVQDKLGEAAGMTREEPLKVCRLAPLSSRRDIALLGLIHRCVLGKGPSHFREFFRADVDANEGGRRQHRLQLQEHSCGHWSDFVFPGSRPATYIANSMLGLVSVYNKLPASIVETCGSVSSFQASLQSILEDRAETGAANWADTFSPRIPWHRHPLRSI